MFDASFTMEIKNNYFIRPGLQYSIFRDNTHPYSKNLVGSYFDVPKHKILTFSLGAGKTVLDKKYKVNVIGSLTYSRFSEPVNIKVSSGGFLSFSENYKFDIEKHDSPGFLAQVEIRTPAQKWLSISLIPYYHFAPGFSTTGIQANFNFGRFQ